MIRQLALPLLFAGVAAPCAMAQVSPPFEDVVIQGEILNRSVGEAIGPQGAGGSAGSNEIAGEAGIYILTINEIFFASGSGGLGYASNPTRTASDAGEDYFGEFNARLGVATRLGGAVDFTAAASVDGRDFLDDDVASSRSVSANASVGSTLWAPLYGSVTAFGGYAFDDSFNNETGFNGLAGNISATFQLAPTLLLRPGVGITGQWSDVSENNSVTGTVSVDVIFAIAPQWTAAGRISASKRDYDDFYEDVTFVKREDDTAGISGSLIWRPLPSTTLAASLSYEKQNSTFYLSEFDAFEGGLNLSFRHTF